MKLQSAYETIGDPEKRLLYDKRLPGIRDRLKAKHGSDWGKAGAAEREKKSAAEETARKQKDYNARQERLRNLELSKNVYDGDIFEIRRVIRKLTADLKHLQEQDEEELKRERARNGWWSYLTSPIYGKAIEPDEQKRTRENERLFRLASKSIKGNELRAKEAKLQSLQDALQDVNSKIAAEKKEIEDEVRAQAARARRERELKMAQEARDRMQEYRERCARAEKEQAERAAKEAHQARAAKEAREAKEAKERVRQAAAADKRRKEAEERAKARRDAFPAESGSTESTCQHDKWWHRLEGRHRCVVCHAVQARFAFQCPDCGMVACAGCRQISKPNTRSSGYSGRRHYYNSHDYD